MAPALPRPRSLLSTATENTSRIVSVVDRSRSTARTTAAPSNAPAKTGQAAVGHMVGFGRRQLQFRDLRPMGLDGEHDRPGQRSGVGRSRWRREVHVVATAPRLLRRLAGRSGLRSYRQALSQTGSLSAFPAVRRSSHAHAHDPCFEDIALDKPGARKRVNWRCHRANTL
jgi:hypothetical protein